MRRLRFTDMWAFLVLGGTTALGISQGMMQGGMDGQRQTGTVPPIQQNPATRPNMPGMTPMSAADPSGVPDVLSSRIAEQQARSRNNERQKRLQADTEKLVGLVTEFNQQMRSEKPLSPEDMSKRAEEIEKLARSVKDRMRG